MKARSPRIAPQQRRVAATLGAIARPSDVLRSPARRLADARAIANSRPAPAGQGYCRVCFGSHPLNGDGSVRAHRDPGHHGKGFNQCFGSRDLPHRGSAA